MGGHLDGRAWGGAWLVATVFSGLPSTVYALATEGDVTEATRAAGAMLVAPGSSWGTLLAAAAVVHGSVSALWTGVAAAVLPCRWPLPAAVLLAAAIGLLSLGVVAPCWFPEVAALAFGPQMADHLMWGACLGGTLQWRQRVRPRPRR